MNRMVSKLLASFLSLILVASMVPSVAFAQGKNDMDKGGGFESVGTRNASETAEAPDIQSGSAEAESNQLAASDQTDDVDESEQNKASGESEESSVESETSEDTVLKESDQNAETSAAAYVYVESPEIDFGR